MNILRNITRICKQPLSFHKAKVSSVHEPPYLDIKPDIPSYDTIYIHMKHYDFVILEKFEKFLHRFFIRKNIDVQNYPVPACSENIRIFIPCSEKVKDEIVLKKYHRILAISNIKSTLLPAYMEFLLQNTPECVELTIEDFNPDIEEFRYVPTLEVDALKEQVDVLEELRKS